MTSKKVKTLTIQYVRSSIGRPRAQKEVIRGLGLRKLRQTVVRLDTPEIRGMIAKVAHLVRIVEGEKS
jgi:large subunit ribosomal protein L30